jgi:neutral ceramidase
MHLNSKVLKFAIFTGTLLSLWSHASFSAGPLTADMPWKAGAASIKITPDKPLPMAGYAGRTKPSEGVDLDLFAKALVLEDSQGAKFVWITLDLIGVPRTLRRRLSEEISKKHGVAPERLVINASHTHCGPSLRSREGTPVDELAQSEDEAVRYTAGLEKRLLDLVSEAISGAFPAAVEYGTSRCGFAMNRRTPDGKGGWKNFPNPDGPVDHRVPVLKVSAEGGREVAVMFGYSCHCTTLGYQNINADYAGYAQQRLEEKHPGAVALFMNGCSGDQNPYPRRSVELAQIHGQTLSTAVDAALETTLKTVSGPIAAAYREIPLAYDGPVNRETLQEQQNSTDKLVASKAKRLLSQLEREGSLPETYPYPVQVLRLGNSITWVFLGGETVVDYSLRLQRELNAPLVWVSGYSNDVMAYIPSLRIWKEGGYEGGGAMVYGSHPARWGANAEEHIVGTVKELLEGLPRQP